MSACIYHDAEAVTICPNCDFGVCQRCMDEGSEGVCATCAEERATRREQSAVQREYATAEVVARCNYCRAAADEDTILDEEGYCETCRVMPRCTTHSDLIAVGNCKSCRQEFCRKCLGFTDICQACAAKQKSRPAAKGPRPEPAAATAGPPKRPPKPGSSAARDGARPKKRRPDDGGLPRKGKPGARGAKGEPAKGGKQGDRRSGRGAAAIEAKLQAGQSGRNNAWFFAVGGGILCAVLLAGWFRPMSDEAYAAKLKPEMIDVQKAALYYYRTHHQLPASADDIKSAMSDLHFSDAHSIKLNFGGQPGGPFEVIFRKVGDGFAVLGSGQNGDYLRSGDQVVTLDQYYDADH